MALGTVNGSDSVSLFKTEMVRQLRQLGVTDFDRWERSVFKACTGREREEVDWSLEQNQTGYMLWVQSFHLLADELVKEGHVQVQRMDPAGQPIMVATETAYAPWTIQMDLSLN